MFRKTMQVFLVLVVLCSFGNASAAYAQVPNGDSVPTAYLPVVVSGVSATESAVTTIEISAAEQEAALAYMTRERIASAEAMEMQQATVPTAAEAAAMAAEAKAAPLGAPQFAKPGRAALNADQVAAAAYAADWAQSALTAEQEAALEAGLEAEAQAAAAAPDAVDGTSQIYTSYIANWVSAMQTQYPHKWVGRLTFSTPSGTSYCSATVLGGNNIVTAAHCLYDTPSRNAWYTNRVFTPAYRNGSAPYGSFAASTCTILTVYVNKSGAYNIASWAPFDIGVCTMGRNSANQTINTAVGWAGSAWDYGYTRHVFNMGYPLRNNGGTLLSWAGAYLRLCSAETFNYSTNVRGMGCNWGGGISGGPWFDHRTLASPTAYGTDGYWPGRVSGYVTSVNSGGFVGVPNIYGARFTNTNFRPLCDVRGC